MHIQIDYSPPECNNLIIWIDKQPEPSDLQKIWKFKDTNNIYINPGRANNK